MSRYVELYTIHIYIGSRSWYTSWVTSICCPCLLKLFKYYYCFCMSSTFQRVFYYCTWIPNYMHAYFVVLAWNIMCRVTISHEVVLNSMQVSLTLHKHTQRLTQTAHNTYSLLLLLYLLHSITLTRGHHMKWNTLRLSQDYHLL